jgi:hypothetical protein
MRAVHRIRARFSLLLDLFPSSLVGFNLETRWNTALRVAQITRFHMSEFINCKGEFTGWKQKMRERLLNTLGQIVVDSVVRSFASIVVLDDWNNSNQKYELDESDLQPYALAGWSCVERSLDWCKEHLYQSPLYIFERGDKHQTIIVC